MFTAYNVQRVAAPRPRTAVDLNHHVGLALQVASARLEARARLVCSLGEPPPGIASPARLTQALAKILLTVAEALPATAPHHAMVRITTVGDPNGNPCVDILVVGRATRDLEMPSDLGDHGPRARSIRTNFEAVARAAGASISCDNEPGVGSWIRLELPAAH